MPTKKVITKKTAPKKTGKSKKAKKNDKLICEKCGLVVSVDNICGCADVCDLLCCGKEMKLKC